MTAPPQNGEVKRTELAAIDPSELRRGEASTSGRGDAVHPVIARAASVLAAGDVVAIPTETVYGLAANALSASAVGKVYAAKNRPADNPLIIHISSIDMLASLYPDGWALPAIYEPVARDLWPGPLTILLPRSPLVPDAVTCGLPTMAVRMPSHPIALALISACGFPLAAPSANSSGRPSPTLARHVLADLDGRIPLVLDGGPCTCGVESTVLDALRSPPAILRPGGVTRERLAAYPGLEGLQVYRRDFVDAALEAAPTTPGMKYRHYSPSAPVLLLDPGDPRARGAGGGADGGGGGDVSDDELAARLRAGAAALLEELAAAAETAAAERGDGVGSVARSDSYGVRDGSGEEGQLGPAGKQLLVGVLRTSLAGLPTGPLPRPPSPAADGPCSGASLSPPPPLPQPSEAAAAPCSTAHQHHHHHHHHLHHPPGMTVVEHVLGHVSAPEGVAAELFAALRRMDELGAGAIVVEGVRDAGAGVAVMNRLRKAASRVVPV